MLTLNLRWEYGHKAHISVFLSLVTAKRAFTLNKMFNITVHTPWTCSSIFLGNKPHIEVLRVQSNCWKTAWPEGFSLIPTPFPPPLKSSQCSVSNPLTIFVVVFSFFFSSRNLRRLFYAACCGQLCDCACLRLSRVYGGILPVFG